MNASSSLVLGSFNVKFRLGHAEVYRGKHKIDILPYLSTGREAQA